MDRVEVPALAEHHAFARMPDGGIGTLRSVTAASATPDASNGTTCGPRATTGPPDDVVFAPYAWSGPWRAGFRCLSRDGASGARRKPFVELANSSTTACFSTATNLARAHAVGTPWPTAGGGAVVALPARELAPAGDGERRAFGGRLSAAITSNPRSEGASAWPKKRRNRRRSLRFLVVAPGRDPAARFPEPDGSFRYATRTRAAGAPNVAWRGACRACRFGSRTPPAHAGRLSRPRRRAARCGRRVGRVRHRHAGGRRRHLPELEGLGSPLYLRARGDSGVAPSRSLRSGRARALQPGLVRILDTEISKSKGGANLLERSFARGYCLLDGEVRGRRHHLAEQMKSVFTVTKNVAIPRIWLIRPTEADQIPRLRCRGSVPALGPERALSRVVTPAPRGLAFGRSSCARGRIRTTCSALATSSSPTTFPTTSHSSRVSLPKRSTTARAREHLEPRPRNAQYGASRRSARRAARATS